MNKKYLFPLFVLFSAIGLAGCAAYYSIIGISTLFSGAFISVSIMALFLELGKISSVTFAYRYWKKCKIYLKIYVIASILVLMMITSLGISAMLMAAYQKSSIEFGVIQDRITSIQNQKLYYEDKIDSSKKRIDELIKIRSSQELRMDEVITNEFLSRNPLQLKQLQQQTIDSISDTDKDIKDENSKIQTAIEDINKINEQVNNIKLDTSKKKDIQTFKFIADALKLPLDTIARWFILLIIFVFDPLAISLILAYNVIVYKKEDDSIYNILVKEPVNYEPLVQVKKEPIIQQTTEDQSKIETNKNIKQKIGSVDDWFKRMFKL